MRKLNGTIFLAATFLLLGAVAFGQAPPGPLPAPPPSADGDYVPPARPVQKMAPRKTILGDWKLNREDSDDPHRKMQERNSTENTNRGGGSRTSGPTIGWPGGGTGGGRQPGGYPGSHGSSKEEKAEDKETMQAILDPTIRLNVAQANPKDPKIEFTGDMGRKIILYTDGRKVEKPKDASLVEVDAHWDGDALVTDESRPKGGQLRRTFRLSSDGLQLFEEVHFTTGKNNTPVTFQYVYDAVNAE